MEPKQGRGVTLVERGAEQSKQKEKQVGKMRRHLGCEAQKGGWDGQENMSIGIVL